MQDADVSSGVPPGWFHVLPFDLQGALQFSYSIDKVSGWWWLDPPPTSVLCSEVEKLCTPPPLDRTISVSPDMPPNSNAKVP